MSRRLNTTVVLVFTVFTSCLPAFLVACADLWKELSAGGSRAVSADAVGTVVLLGAVTLILGVVVFNIIRRAFVDSWRQRRRMLHRCEYCGYNLSGNLSGVCPECGTRIEQE